MELLGGTFQALYGDIIELLWVMLVPSGVRVVLRKLGLMLRDEVGVLVKDDESGGANVRGGQD